MASMVSTQVQSDPSALARDVAPQHDDDEQDSLPPQSKRARYSDISATEEGEPSARRKLTFPPITATSTTSPPVTVRNSQVQYKMHE